jgi:hypothetical protein
MVTSSLALSAAPLERAGASRACAGLLIFSIVFQKFAIPGTHGGVGLSLVALLLVALWLLLRDELRICPQTAMAGALFFATSAISVAISASPRLSTASWYLLLVVQAPLALCLARDAVDYRALLRLLSTLGGLLAVVGLAQLAVQAVMGPDVAFWLDYHIPSGVALQGYNQLNGITWDATVFKSNGVFFSEPSYFSQFLAICLLAELAVGARAWRLLLIGAGLLGTYSGTGLITLALFLPFHVPRHAARGILIAVALLVVVGLVAGSSLHLDALTGRIDEVGAVGTSGYARFVSIFEFLRQALSKDVTTLLFGRGPGTVTEFHASRPYEVFAPTYAKVLYEYGVVGFAAYGAFLWTAVLRRGPLLAWPVAFTFVLLGGYLQDSAIVAWMLVIAGWHKLSVAQSHGGGEAAASAGARQEGRG